MSDEDLRSLNPVASPDVAARRLLALDVRLVVVTLGSAGTFAVTGQRKVEVIRQNAAMPVSRFCALIGIPRRSYARWQAKARAGGPPKGPCPAPVVDAVEPLVAKYAGDWPGWGHRKIYGMMRADGHRVSVSSVERAMRCRGLLQPVDYQGERREHAKAVRRRSPSRSPA